jgi:hypothetical protein
MKYNPKRDLPEFARQAKTLSPSKLAELVLNRRNREVTSESITMWFKRHPEIYDELSKEIVEGIPTEKQAVDASIFENSSFRAIPSVKEWIDHLRGVRRIKETTINAIVRDLKLICKGQLPHLKIDLVQEGLWSLKHPDRLNYTDAVEITSLFKERKVDLYRFSKCLKSFLVNKGIPEGAKLLVGKPRGFGRFAKMYVARETLDKMLLWILEKYGLEPYACDVFMFTKAARVNAALNANIEDIQTIQGQVTLTIYEKGLERKYGEKGKPVDKDIEPELFNLLKKVFGERQFGRIFENLTIDKMTAINTEAIKQFCPEILQQYGHVNPNHFWRHMFAQHMLIKTKWNYAIVAGLGNWTVQALEESYGKASPQQVKKWGKEYSIEFLKEEKVIIQIPPLEAVTA